MTAVQPSVTSKRMLLKQNEVYTVEFDRMTKQGLFRPYVYRNRVLNLRKMLCIDRFLSVGTEVIRTP